MADSVDRVFVHALNTVKKIPKTGASRPPSNDRLRLYGLYKQAMEGDVDGVMERPSAVLSGIMGDDELQREKDKWDAWNTQSGLSRTEAKRRYIEALIETMHRFATTPDAKELVDELEFVWNQIKNINFSNSPVASEISPQSQSQLQSQPQLQPQTRSSESRVLAQPKSGTDGPMKMLSPMSEDDEAERQFRAMEGEDAEAELPEDHDSEYVKKGDRWSRKVERAVVRLSAEIAALREQITTGREWRSKKERSLTALIRWLLGIAAKHFAIDLAILGVVLLWMRRRKDSRLEDLVRSTLSTAREYARMVLPSR